VQNGYFGVALIGSTIIHLLLFFVVHITNLNAKPTVVAPPQPIMLSLFEEPKKEEPIAPAQPKKVEKKQKLKQKQQEPQHTKQAKEPSVDAIKTVQAEPIPTVSEPQPQQQKQKPSPPQTQNNDEVKKYLSKVRKILQDNLEYPHFARKAGIEGVATVCFCIRADGSVPKRSLRILKSSGSSALDIQALETVQNSAPFISPPKGELEVSIPVSFALNS